MQEEFELRLQQVIDNFVNKNHLCQENVVFKENKEDKKGDTVKSVSFVEFEYPSDSKKPPQIAVIKPLLRVEFKKSFVNVNIPFRTFDEIKAMNDSFEVHQNQTTKFVTIKVTELTPALFDIIDETLTVSYANYCSSQDSFGCCSLYEKCSDVKRCIHENQFYAKKCSYRGNLEAGKIFYGKNKNING
jgi:hypothetical protein